MDNTPILGILAGALVLGGGGYTYYKMDQALIQERAVVLQHERRIAEVENAGSELVGNCRKFDAVLKEGQK
jgi:hypothetical protein